MKEQLQIQNVSMRLGSFELKEFSLGLNRGDYFVLLGPSGCGKTTLLRTIAGVYQDYNGCVCIGGEDVNGIPPERRRIGYVSQSEDLFPHLNVRKNVAFGLRYTGWDRQEQEEQLQRIIEWMGISGLAEQFPKTLSGGESRRVALARALVVKPRVLLLDEPLGMLDPNARETMIDILKRIHRQTDTTTIHVTHDREEAWMLEGWCGVMMNGQLLQTGSVAEVFRQPGNRAVADFFGGTNIFEARFERRENGVYAMTEFSEFLVEQNVPHTEGAIQLRPETLTFGNSARAEPDRKTCFGKVDAVIRNVSDRGAYLRFETETDNQAELIVDAGHEYRRYAPGERVRLFCRSSPQPLTENTGTEEKSQPLKTG
mgnify:CR=1 FL=1